MNQRTLKTLIAAALVLGLLLSMCSIAFAQERMITSTTSSFVRDSSTKGTATVSANSSNPDTPYMKSKITLQEAPLGTKNFVDSNVAPKTKTTYYSSIIHSASFTISTSKEYRVKIEITDNTNGTDYTVTFYENLQE